MSPNAKSPGGSLVQKSAGAEPLAPVLVLIDRLRSIAEDELLNQGTRRPMLVMEDVHDTAVHLVKAAARVLSDRDQQRLPL